MANDITKTNYADLSAEQRSFYVRTLLDRLVGAFPHRDYGQKAIVPRNQGLGVEWRLLNSLSAATSALTEGTPPAESSFTITTVTASLSQYGAYLAGSDRLLAAGKDPVLAECADLLGEQMAKSLDTITRDVLAAGTVVQYAGVAGSRGGVGSGMVISAAEVREAVRTLKTADARPVKGGKYICFLAPASWHDLMGDSSIVNAIQYTQNDGLFTGRMPEWMGVGFVETSNAKCFASYGMSGADVYATVIVGAGAYGIVELNGETVDYIYEPPGGNSDPLRQRWTAGWKASYCARILSDSSMVRIEHVCTTKQAA